MKLILNLKAGTRLAGISTIIVFDITRIVLIITLLEDNNEDDNIVRVIKLIPLDYYNDN